MTGEKIMSKVPVEGIADLNLYQDRFGGDYSIWLDAEGSERDGLCIATGLSRAGTVSRAMVNLAQLIVKLKELEGPTRNEI
jgi:hypothetical protein